MSTRARVQVAMSTSTGHRTVHGVSQKPPCEHSFCDTAARGVGSGWHFAPPPPRTAVMIMFSTRELLVMCGCMPPATWSARMRARSASQLGQNFAFERDGSKDRRSHVTPTGTAFFVHGRDSGSYTHVQRARVTVRVNAGVHRGLGAIMPKKSRKKKSRDI